MKEVETRILEVNHKDLELKLFSLGAKKIFDDEVYTLRFDTKESRITKNKEKLRLRKLGDKYFLAYKKRLSNDGARIENEIEIEISNFDDAKKILNLLGFEEYMRIKKRRVSLYFR